MLYRIENVVEKDEIAHFEQFHLFPQCFPSFIFFFFFLCIKMSKYGGKGQHVFNASLLKTVGKEELLVKSNFSPVERFVSFWRSLNYFINLKLLPANSSSLEFLNFVVKERV